MQLTGGVWDHHLTPWLSHKRPKLPSNSQGSKGIYPKGPAPKLCPGTTRSSLLYKVSSSPGPLPGSSCRRQYHTFVIPKPLVGLQQWRLVKSRLEDIWVVVGRHRRPAQLLHLDSALKSLSRWVGGGRHSFLPQRIRNF